MKKWLIALGVLALIGVAAAAIAGYQLNKRFGWWASTPVYHDTLIAPETRLVAAVDTLRLARDLTPYLPEDVGLPGWLPLGLPAILPRVAPREVAVLGASDFRAGTYDLTLFINEQRGGPYLPTHLNQRTRFRQSLPAITWEEPGFQLEERGVLSARGRLEIPMGLEADIRETWAPDPPPEPLALHGGHLAEAVIDNRNGEVVTLIGTLAPVWDSNLDQLKEDQNFRALLTYLADVRDLRAAADFEDPDTLVIQLRLNANPEIGGQLEFILPIIIEEMVRGLRQQHGLAIRTEYAWKPDVDTYVADFRLTGMEDSLTAYFRGLAPRAPAGGAQ